MSLSTVWDWKMEPESPGFIGLDPSEDVWLFDDDDVKQVTVVTEDDEKPGQPTTRAQVAAKLLDDLDEWIKEEPFNEWLEEKIDLPIFEDLPPLDQRTKHRSLDTQALLQEFETVFGEVELNNGALTPPQSPPLVPELLLSQDDRVTYSIGSDGQVMLLHTLSVPKAYMETTCALDELVRSRAADMAAWEMSGSCNDSSESDFVLSPPESGSDSSNSGAEVSGNSGDPEWVDPPPKRRRAKPYARPVEDKKLRKKEQNKNAATRYRQKKKAEVDVILGEEKGLLDHNTDLHKNVDELSREIKYLKALMRDLFKAKGLLK